MNTNVPGRFPVDGHHHVPEQGQSYPVNTVIPLNHEGHLDSAIPPSAKSVVKHRRSRSGCLTCRTRRVKCDEQKPVCERCRKGSRTCQYPAERPKGEISPTVPRTIQEEISSDEEDSDFKQSPSAMIVADNDKHGGSFDATLSTNDTAFTNGTQGFTLFKSGSRTPSLTFEQSQSPSSEGSESQSRSMRNLSHIQDTRAQIAAAYDFSPDSLISFYKSHITRHHYRLKNDDFGFLHGFLLEEAARFEPLKQALLAFAAFHYSMFVPESTLQCFLKFYNESLRRLSKFLVSNQEQSVVILLTMLQLALVAEYMGDWGNLRAHKKAAQSVLTALFTPETIATSDHKCKILEWYLRLDLSIGFVSAERDTIERSWYQVAHSYFLQKLVTFPNSTSYKLEERATSARLLTCDMRRLFLLRANGAIELDDFEVQLNDFRQRFREWNDETNSLRDKVKLVQDLPPHRVSTGGIANSFGSELLYGDDLYPLNLLCIDIWGLELLFEYHGAISLNRKLPPACLESALRIYRMIETIDRCSGVPTALLDTSGVLALLPNFLPKDGKHIYWALQKLSAVEAAGYVYPAFVRNRLAETWGIELSPGWLPTPTVIPGAEAAATHEPLAVPPQISRVRRFVETGDRDDPGSRLVVELTEMFIHRDWSVH